MLFTAGLDEAGRGPLAGPVTAACVIFRPHYRNSEINDSKKLTAKIRARLAPEIIANCLAYSIVSVGPRRIERLNIREASRVAMELAAKRVLDQLFSIYANPRVCFLVDGNVALATIFESEPIIKGDEKILNSMLCKCSCHLPKWLSPICYTHCVQSDHTLAKSPCDLASEILVRRMKHVPAAHITPAKAFAAPQL